MKRFAIVAALALLPLFALAETSTWNIDPAHSQAMFTVRHMVITNVRGQFQKTTGTARIDEADLTRSSVEATIDAASIDTRVEARDGHLRSPDFFDVAKYPTITFRSTKVEKAGQGKLKVTGDLTIHGVTKPVVLDVDGPSAPIKDGKGLRRGLTATTSINRQDFGLKWNKMVEAGPVVADEVKIEIEAELTAAGDQQAKN
ncbi:MAG TPA: YceI family protein [Anaeromyxobacter sp.]|nr:YceI family protein [Anaeromyxobacter sp.]